MKKLILSAVVGVVAASTGMGGVDTAFARSHHHHNNTGAAVAGGIAAGVIGGLVGGAIANNREPRYVDPGPPPPRCWVEDRRVQNAYDGGWHVESVRVCE
ncbi:MAG: hypothetical protein AAAB20_11290 [Rhizobium sp.]|jgi:hypothetical protein|uniref:hypothetical protein n=1 Tax=Rhizobium sp. TaxID=391 RepID=UPI00055EB875